MPDRDKALEIIGLAENIARHASDLVKHGDESRQVNADEINAPQNCDDTIFFKDDLLEKCQRIYKLRREREQLFGKPGMFCDPAWDILLDLFIGYLRGDRISVTSVGIAACAPITTALRWLTILEKDGLVTREHDMTDRRRIFVTLTDPAIASMTKMMENF